MRNPEIGTFNSKPELSLDELGLGVNFEEVERRNLEELAEKVQAALFELTGPYDTETVAQLLEAYANRVRQGEI